MRTTAAALTACLLLATLAGTMAAAPSTPPADTGPAVDEVGPVVSTPAVAADDVGPTDRTAASQDGQSNATDRPDTIEIRLAADGDAQIVLVWQRPIETEAEADAFQRLADDFERGEYDLGYDAWASIVPRVAAETGREMSLSAPSYNATLEDGVGRLEQRFTWQNFGTVGNDTVSVGDAFHLGDGVWLDRLTEGQQLVVRSPDHYTVTQSSPGPQLSDDDLIWTGPESFRQGDFAVTFEREPQDTPEADGGGLSTLALAGLGGVFLLVLLAVVVLLLLRSDRTVALPGLGGGAPTASGEAAEQAGDVAAEQEATDAGTTGGTAQAADEAETTPPARDANHGAEAGNASGADSESAASADASTGEDTEDAVSAPPDVDLELLSDEERVKYLLEENGGRMKQASIVKETGWSNAKVSQLLSRMAEDDEVDKLRIGRENLITLPDVDVTDTE